jgi:tryptophanyl-tRNA synthetase
VLNLLAIYQGFSGDADDAIKTTFTGMRYGDLKKQVAEMVISHLEPFQQRYREITADPAYLAGILRDGAERVAPIANDTVRTVKQRMGLYT